MFDSLSIPAPDLGLEEELYFPQIRNEFENGSVQSRRKFTKEITRWPDMGWTAMVESDFQLLKAHFLANQGGTFSFTHPVTGTTYTVRYSDDVLRSAFTDPPGAGVSILESKRPHNVEISGGRYRGKKPDWIHCRLVGGFGNSYSGDK